MARYIKKLLLLIAILFSFFLSVKSYSNEEFKTWLELFKKRAIAQGISSETVNESLKNVRFLERIVELDRKQPEFIEKTYEYINKRIDEKRIINAQIILKNQKEVLNNISEKFKVDKEIIVALWGIETNFGINKGKVDIISALATLSFDKRRSAYFENELIILLQLIDKKIIQIENLLGSWAGAVGNFQFMPSTIQKYALNLDDKLGVDLFDSLQDSIGSAANYLSKIGWRFKEIWGFEIKSTKKFDSNILTTDTKNFKEQFTLSELKILGFKHMDNREFADSDKKGWIIRPDGNDGPIYIVYDNFLRLLEWNRSLSFAITVGTLSNKIKI